MYTFGTEADAREALVRIASHTGLEPNFDIRAANVPNAAAVIDNAGRRLILYNQRFMDRVRDATRTDWSAISILAHEVGHHLQSHTLQPGGSRPSFELEADKYSGFVLRRMGASLEEAIAAMRTFGGTASSTHPGAEDRIDAIYAGWKMAEELEPQAGGGSTIPSDLPGPSWPPGNPAPSGQSHTLRPVVASRQLWTGWSIVARKPRESPRRDIPCDLLPRTSQRNILHNHSR